MKLIAGIKFILTTVGIVKPNYLNMVRIGIII